MSTEFISLQPPPGDSISDYKRSAPSKEQPDHIPVHFKEAMSIREQVFGHEQKVPLENELDDDDPRSWHWLTYVSMGSAPATTQQSSGDSSEADGKNGSTASRVAAATIRLVPPPHAPHPPPGSQNKIDARQPQSHSRQSSSAGADSHSIHNPDNEPYVKLGRLSTLQPFRKLGLGRLLVDTALEWAASHAEEILPPPSATAREASRAEMVDDEEWAKEWEKKKWRGLVLVHAQSSIVEWWGKRGFVIDEGLGEWDEEGISHVGMWKRIGLKEKR